MGHNIQKQTKVLRVIKQENKIRLICKADRSVSANPLFIYLKLFNFKDIVAF